MTEEVVRTRRLELVDENDEVRAQMSVGSDGDAMLYFFGAAGATARIGVDREGAPVLNLQAGEGYPKAGLTAAGPRGGSHQGAILLTDQNGKIRAHLTIREDSSTTLMLYDEQGSGEWGAISVK